MIEILIGLELAALGLMVAGQTHAALAVCWLIITVLCLRETRRDG